MVTAPAQRQAKIHTQRGEEAFRRYVAGSPAGQDAELAAAEGNFTQALQCLTADDPMRADVSFLLGAVRLAAHENRCGENCTAPGELAPIVGLIALGGARNGAPAGQLSLYAIAVDKLYDHTGDPADIDLAIDWLRRTARDVRLPAAERRRMLINLAVQYANRGKATRESQYRSGPGTESWACFDAAIRQFDEVLAKAGPRGTWRDSTRATDRLDAWLG